MKTRILTMLASLLLLVFITLSSSCAITVAEQRPPRHRQRTVWVSGVRYRQVYYIDNTSKNVIIVNQTEVPHKPPKHHKDKGKHKGH
jgi:hypothetical protein